MIFSSFNFLNVPSGFVVVTMVKGSSEQARKLGRCGIVISKIWNHCPLTHWLTWVSARRCYRIWKCLFSISPVVNVGETLLSSLACRHHQKQKRIIERSHLGAVALLSPIAVRGRKPGGRLWSNRKSQEYQLWTTVLPIFIMQKANLKGFCWCIATLLWWRPAGYWLWSWATGKEEEGQEREKNQKWKIKLTNKLKKFR